MNYVKPKSNQELPKIFRIFHGLVKKFPVPAPNAIAKSNSLNSSVEEIYECINSPSPPLPPSLKLFYNYIKANVLFKAVLEIKTTPFF